MSIADNPEEQEAAEAVNLSKMGSNVAHTVPGQ